MIRRRHRLTSNVVATALWMATALAPGTGPLDFGRQPSPAPGGGLVVGAVDPAGEALTGACAELWSDAGGGTRGTLMADSLHCDAPLAPTGRLGPEDQRVDGTLGWSELPAGSYVVVETRAPDGYEVVGDLPVKVGAAAVSHETLVHGRLGGLTLTKVDPAGAPLAGACFELRSQSDERDKVALCDGPDSAGMEGDGLADGILVMVPPAPTRAFGDYTLHEWYPPYGYAAAVDRTVRLGADRSTHLTLANAAGAAGSGGLGEVVSLEFEFESAIEVRSLSGFPVRNGMTVARGRIVLEPDGSGAWRGTGELASTTTSDPGTACPSTHVRGEGTYDWVVRNVHAGPDLAAEDIEVSMDAGPIVENPDVATTDYCTESFDSDVNTWESHFFDVYRSRFKAAGFLVDGWTLVGRADAWSTGGLIAEATWTGDCSTPLVFACTDHTRFRLYGRAAAAGAVAASPTTVVVAGAPTTVISTATPGIGVGGPAADCGDIIGCNPVLVAVIALGGVLAAVGLGLFLWYRTMGARRILPLPPPPGGTMDFDKSPPFGKVAPDARPTDFDKSPPIDKFTPDARPTDFDK